MGIIKNKIITVYGDPGSWKTLISVFFVAYFYLCWVDRIYSNVEYKYKGRVIGKSIKDIKDIERIKFSEVKGLVILDEWGLNVNSRRSMSNDNMEYGKLGMLWRKKNVDIIIIAQLDYSIDKYFRDLSFASLYMDSFFVKKDYLSFEATIFKKDYLVGKKEFDLFYLIQNTFFEYNTLEESLITSWEEWKKNRIFKKETKKKAENLNEDIEKRIVENIFDLSD